MLDRDIQSIFPILQQSGRPTTLDRRADALLCDGGRPSAQAGFRSADCRRRHSEQVDPSRSKKRQPPRGYIRGTRNQTRTSRLQVASSTALGTVLSSSPPAKGFSYFAVVGIINPYVPKSHGRRIGPDGGLGQDGRPGDLAGATHMTAE